MVDDGVRYELLSPRSLPLQKNLGKGSRALRRSRIMCRSNRLCGWFLEGTRSSNATNKLAAVRQDLEDWREVSLATDFDKTTD